MAIRVVPVSDETLRELTDMGGAELDLIAHDIEPVEPDQPEGQEQYRWTSRMLTKARLYIADFKRVREVNE